jgi:hypothetical protein
MTAGYREPFDPRPLLTRLRTEDNTAEVWQQLWGELHHQGDVGEASFAAVPFLVEICQQRSVFDWNTYAMVATIELARNHGKNPDVPQWMADEYFRAIDELASLALKGVLQAEGADNIRAMLSIVAIKKGLRMHGRFLVQYSEDELAQMESGLWQ